MSLLLTLSLIIFCRSSIPEHENAFVVHSNKCKPICFYETNEFRHPILKTYPNSEGAGIMLRIIGSVEKGFRVKINDEIYYVKVGSLAVNPRGETIRVYDSPNIGGKSRIIPILGISEPLKVYGWQDGWVRTVISVNGSKVSGWISPQNQCPSPYTTCP